MLKFIPLVLSLMSFEIYSAEADSALQKLLNGRQYKLVDQKEESDCPEYVVFENINGQLVLPGLSGLSYSLDQLNKGKIVKKNKDGSKSISRIQDSQLGLALLIQFEEAWPWKKTVYLESHLLTPTEKGFLAQSFRVSEAEEKMSSCQYEQY